MFGKVNWKFKKKKAINNLSTILTIIGEAKELGKKILLKDEENIIAQFTLRDGK